MNNHSIGSRYLSSFDVARMNSSEECGDNPKDCVIKHLWVKAVQNDIKEWELIAGIEIETVDIDEFGVDNGAIHLQHEAIVYRVPFPYDLSLRKIVIRSFIEHPKFFIT